MSTNMTVKKTGIREPKSDRALYIINGILIGIFTLIVLYPLIYIISSSFSSAMAVSLGRVVLFPVDFSLDGYKAVFAYPKVWIGYGNTILYTVTATVVNIIVTMMTAYPLAMPRMQFKKFYMFLFTFSMYFSGGIVPQYLLCKDLHLINTFWVMVIPVMISVYNLIVARTFIQTTIPAELLEASQIDGCSWARYFISIIVPLSKPIIAVLVLYYAVSHWNSYFNAMIYLNDDAKYPLQLVLREILIENSMDFVDVEVETARANMAALMKFSLIIVSSVPIMCIYPFIQKYFMKGVMIGSVKG